MHKTIALLAALLLGTAHAQVPHTFQAGAKASAAAVNDNFAHLSSQLGQVANRVDDAATKADVAKLASKAAAADTEIQALKNAVAALQGMTGTDVPAEDLSWILGGSGNIRGGNWGVLMNWPVDAPFTRTWATSANHDNNPVLGAFCPISAERTGPTTAVSIGCECHGDGEFRNFGVLSICQTTSSGGVAACFYEASTYNPELLPPRAELQLICYGEPGDSGMFPSNEDDSRRAVPVQFRTNVPGPVQPDPNINVLPSQRKDSTVQAVQKIAAQDWTELDAALNEAWDQWFQHALALKAH